MQRLCGRLSLVTNSNMNLNLTIEIFDFDFDFDDMSLVGDAFNAHIYSIQHLSNLLLNIVTDMQLTTSCGKLFQILTTRREKNFFRKSSRER